jgi:hypothetical protein
MNRPRTSGRLTAMPNSLSNEILFTRLHGNSPPFDEQGVTTLHDQHVLVEAVRMRRGNRSFPASPERHLTPIRPVEDVTFHSRRRLAARRDPVRGPLHEFRKIVHISSFHRNACANHLRTPLAYRFRAIPSLSPFNFLRF